MARTAQGAFLAFAVSFRVVCKPDREHALPKLVVVGGLYRFGSLLRSREVHKAISSAIFCLIDSFVDVTAPKREKKSLNSGSEQASGMPAT
eukprot:CAMPEP_0181419122 /NCGR_PEP_ID=MMETSP1110-20121109/11911_1 /TAXON_ID=174948 /ORGANISM="Symbiodinium sp., Strain CCMP421" /LENGTH=90 /DNA_ID=CAMNT_0023542129 /DNA_START=668 /DNA_END=941 /DNA_ORIENTATION=-